MVSGFAAKGVDYGLLDASDEFTTTFAIGQIGRKFGPAELLQELLPTSAWSAEAFISETVARNSEAPQKRAEGVFPPVISDHQGVRRGRKLKALQRSI